MLPQLQRWLGFQHLLVLRKWKQICRTSPHQGAEKAPVVSEPARVTVNLIICISSFVFGIHKQLDILLIKDLISLNSIHRIHLPFCQVIDQPGTITHLG